MEHLALERLDSLQLREFGYDQHADGGYDGRRARQLLLAGAHVASLNAPLVRLRIPFSLVQRRVETTMFAQAVLVCHFMHILQNFWLGAMEVFPIRFEVCG